MFLTALGLYSYSADLKLDTYKTKEQFGPFKFPYATPDPDTPDHPLAELAKDFLPRLPDEAGVAKRFVSDKYYHYLAKLEDPKIVIGISSKSRIDSDELNILIDNIVNKCLPKENKPAELTLDDILRENTYKYTTNHHKLFKVQRLVTQVTDTMTANLKMAHDNTNLLKSMEKKTIILDKSATEFLEKAKRTKNCCYGYVPRPF